MKHFEDNEYFLLKSLSQTVIKNVSPVRENLKKQSEKLVLEIKTIDKKLEDSESGADINKYSKLSDEKRREIIRLLAIKNRLDAIIEKNNSRIKYIESILKNSGIYNESFDKKLIANVEKDEEENISKETLGLNSFDGEGEVETNFFSGEILKLKDGELDFSYPENRRVLKSASDDFLSDILKSYPSSMATIPVDLLVDTSLKKRVLRTIATYVIDEAKKRDMKDINKSLGNLLEFKTQIADTPEAYIAGVSNMINVEVRQFLIDQEPQKQEEIKSKLKCNEKSELIPESKRIAVLSGGVMGEISSEKEESEEMRKEREKEDQKTNDALELLDQLIEELDIQADIEAEQDEISDLEDMKKQQEEVHKKDKEQKKQEKLEAMDEQELLRAMSKNRYDD